MRVVQELRVESTRSIVIREANTILAVSVLSDAQGRWAQDQYPYGIAERASLLCFRPQSECLVTVEHSETPENRSGETQLN